MLLWSKQAVRDHLSFIRQARGPSLELSGFSNAHPAPLSAFSDSVTGSLFHWTSDFTQILTCIGPPSLKRDGGTKSTIFSNRAPGPSLCCPQALVSFLDTRSEGILQESYLKTRFTLSLFHITTQTSRDPVTISGTLLSLRSSILTHDSAGPGLNYFIPSTFFLTTV